MSEPPIDQAPVVDRGVPPAPVFVGLTPLAQQYLDETRPWVRFISILTFVTAGFMLIVGMGLLAFSLLGGIAGIGQRGLGELGGPIGGGLVALLYVALAFVYLLPATYLFRYASAIAALKGHPSAAGLEHALKQQKSFWRVVGILTVIGMVAGLAILVLAVVAAAIAAVMSAR